MSRNEEDLKQAKELYFSLGGMPSQSATQREAPWYWRRSAKIMRGHREGRARVDAAPGPTHAPLLGTVDIDAPLAGQCFHFWEDGRCKTCGKLKPTMETMHRLAAEGEAARELGQGGGGLVLRDMLKRVLRDLSGLASRVDALEGAHKTWATETGLSARRLLVLEVLGHEKAEELERLADELKLLADFVGLPEGLTHG